MLARLPSVPVGDQVYELLRRAILSLEFEPSQPISENALVAGIGVSRTPIREALQRLQRDGLVIILPQRGSFVAPLDLEAIRTAYFVRLSLESTAAFEAATRRDADDLAALRDCVARQRQLLRLKGDAAWVARRERFFGLNQDFHRELMRIARVPGAWTYIESAKLHLDRVRSAHLTYAAPYPLSRLVEEHAQIVEAIGAGDAAKAEAAMRQHIAAVLPRLDLLRKRKPDFFKAPHDYGKPLELRLDRKTRQSPTKPIVKAEAASR